MQLVVITTRGKTYKTRYTSRSDYVRLQNKGEIPKGQTYDQQVQEFQNMLRKFSSLAYLSIECDGVSRFFNPVNVEQAYLVVDEPGTL